MPHAFVRDFRDGETVNGVYLLLERELRQGAQNPYLHLLLGDRTGRVVGRLWDAGRPLADSLPADGLVRVVAQVRTWKGQIQLNVSRIVAAPGEGDSADYLPCTEADPDALARELDAALRAVADPDLRRLAEAVLADPAVAASLRRVPAAAAYHHACVGGLLEHIVSLLRLAAAVAPLYPALDRDLLTLGILLHDIGKVEELAVGSGFRYTDAGRLVGHIGLGLALLERAARSLEHFPPARLDLLRHLIASHHGRPEWGALCEPATLEAIALHHLDNLDAKLNAASRALRDAAATPGNWTEFIRMFDRSLYKGDGAEKPRGAG